MIVDFRQFGVGSKVILHNTVGEPSTSAVMRFDVVRGGAEEARIPKKLARGRGAAGGQRGARVAADLPGPRGRRLGVADRRRRVLGDADRLPAAPGLDRAVDVGQPLRRARTRCTCTATTSASSACNGKPPHPGDAGWKDTVAVYPQPDRRRAAVLRLLPGRLRLPLPRRRARRHVDDGPDGGGRVIRRVLAGRGARRRAAGPGRLGQRGGHARRPGLRHADVPDDLVAEQRSPPRPATRSSGA